MATLNPQIPSPDTFLCESRSSFVSAAKLRFVDNSCSDTSHTELYRRGEAVSLGKEEMLGYRALEDCCLVVCHVCNQVVTPQGILTHYGKTHAHTHTHTHTHTCNHTHTQSQINTIIDIYLCKAI
ncbi:Ataxin-7-like protein 1 [Liparis tanakae]|uniref:Ataxin-7-like protein 1 n=1 Tax=Liparis tanakae TaxID=230148 RepID=A0A4Z2FHE8_9TELE|nr:Ataxin-7-like protein 1 [Liparis tanakae]